ncbi:MAG: iron-containing alcohol dehydrogenase [Candidatus Bipolaricaulota bacterium]|nr:iron-containing alcohol dehydrogenase [Candidatus Bipolaricaulota bacterium]MBS3791027.1 iron-containing alcohol dehydrogenase [Candidatus Bipolaricaulota bacterium]
MNRKEDYFDFILPTKVKFGPGLRNHVVKEIVSRDFQRVGIVTTEDILELGLPEGITEELKSKGRVIEVFSNVTSNPHLSTISEGYEAFRGFQPDCLIGLGGGSAIDATKAISLCLANDEPDIVQLDRRDERPKPCVPFFAVPTTSGTGSEVDYWAVISDSRSNRKLSIGSPEMAPLTAVIDPELTLTLPPELTFFTGIDAFSHALEAYFSSASNELSDTLSIKAMELVFRSLETAVENGEDLSARGDLSLASTLGGASMQHVGLGLIHAMSHQVSGFYDTNHGLANARLTLPVLNFNQAEVPERFEKLERQLGGNLRGKIERIFEILDLSQYRVTIKEGDLDEMVDRAITNVNAETNPRQPVRSEIEKLYRESFIVE